MPPKARRKHHRSPLPDALSYLPDNIIDVILMCLPCKDAVRTSILSKKWRYHWNDIQHLVLHLPLRKIYKLPSSLFTCSLRHLSLCYCSIHHPSTFQRFDNLISLELCEVTMSSELLESLISHCPLLEKLVLDIQDKLDTIEINAPLLRSFDLTGNISSICLKNVPRLVKLFLHGDYINAEDLDFTKIFESSFSRAPSL
ncbi:hypothetical protein T459_08432 [Capsicum annuum]|uniref:F-box domain-containing protein n=1 Tax=Capsicum annuum TaxID=4072 RepID=A0A2G2ZWJ7_CAPAN|nr:hypothetical protein T459_08432 [Capsicum annuum]